MNFDSYEYISVVVPGAVPALTVWWLLPEVRVFFGSDGFEIGELGIFFVVSFIVGQMVQTLGNALEQIHRWFSLGKEDLPFTRWRGVDTDRWRRFEEACRHRFGGEGGAPNRENWSSLSAEIYAALEAAGMTRRLDAFTRTYGLARGMVAGSLLAFVFVVWLGGPTDWTVAIGLLVFAGMMYARMWRFSRSYVREIVAQFLELSKRQEQ